ncbi:MAG: T9SS type A sorting domain-containing protein [Chitinophagaceae bacterium]|nr:T9SS type A sorting domain-containing protein [Chitinophagaceae bacterium]
MKIITVTQGYRSVQRVIKLVVLTLFIAQSFAFAGERRLTIKDNIAQNGYLPVVWTPLKGYCSQGISYLSWSSLQESNSSHYEIQRSDDGLNFYNTGKVIAQSVSDKVVEYGFNDSKANEGINYYRIKYYDNDGHFQFSNTITLNVRIKGITITTIYPGPFVDRVNVTIASDVRANCSITMFDNSGKILVSQQSMLNKGVTTLVVDKLENLAKGIYIMKVQAGETILTQKLIK